MTTKLPAPVPVSSAQAAAIRALKDLSIIYSLGAASYPLGSEQRELFLNRAAGVSTAAEAIRWDQAERITVKKEDSR